GPAELAGHDFANVGADVEPDDVGELDRTHRHPEIHGDLIDDLERHPFLGRVHGLVQIRHEHAVDDKSWGATTRHRQLIQAASETGGRLGHIGPRGGPIDDLDELHLRYRIEKVQPDQALG